MLSSFNGISYTDEQTKGFSYKVTYKRLYRFQTEPFMLYEKLGEVTYYCQTLQDCYSLAMEWSNSENGRWLYIPKEITLMPLIS